MPRINLSHEQVIAVLPLIQPGNGSAAVIRLTIRKSKRVFKKGDRLFMYFRNLNRRWEKLGELNCKKVEIIFEGDQELTLKNTYDRRYYLNRRVKLAGFDLNLEQTSKTIGVRPAMVREAMTNKWLGELGVKYNYGIQFTMNL